MRLALLPGLDGTGLLFDPLIAELPADLNPLVVRYPASSTASLTCHVDAAAEAMSGGERWLVLAESFSGPVAARLILDRPGLEIGGLIFCASFLTPPRRRLLALIRHAPLQALFGKSHPDWLVRALCLGSDADQQIIDRFHHALSQTGPKLLAARMRMLSALPAFGEKLAIPSLYLRPRRDRLVTRASMRDVARRCRQLETAEIDGPHFILQTRPVPCAKAIVEFAATICWPAAASHSN